MRSTARCRAPNRSTWRCRTSTPSRRAEQVVALARRQRTHAHGRHERRARERAHAGHAALERHVEGEDAAVGRDHPVAPAVRGAPSSTSPAPRAACCRSSRGTARCRTRTRRRRRRRTSSPCRSARHREVEHARVEVHAAGRAVEVRVAEGEDAAVGAEQDVAPAVGVAAMPTIGEFSRRPAIEP